jgi:hypothetical protein
MKKEGVLLLVLLYLIMVTGSVVVALWPLGQNTWEAQFPRLIEEEAQKRTIPVVEVKGVSILGEIEVKNVEEFFRTGGTIRVILVKKDKIGGWAWKKYFGIGGRLVSYTAKLNPPGWFWRAEIKGDRVFYKKDTRWVIALPFLVTLLFIFIIATYLSYINIGDLID